jgi:hypothetical protein
MNGKPPGHHSLKKWWSGKGGTAAAPGVSDDGHKPHRGDPIRIGKYTLLAGGTRDLLEEDLGKADVLVPLAGFAPFEFGKRYTIISATMQDMGGVPKNWREFLESTIIPEIKARRRLLAFCVGGHGRTGTFLASLIALLESREETPDPIWAVWQRHCIQAVESREQAEAIFALRGEELPPHHKKVFPARKVFKWAPVGGHGVGAGQYTPVTYPPVVPAPVQSTVPGTTVQPPVQAQGNLGEYAQYLAEFAKTEGEDE